MKKNILLLLALVLGLSACGKSETPKPAEQTSAPASETVPAEAEPEETAEAEPEDLSFHGKGTIEETVLVDEEGIRITLTDIDYSSTGFGIKLLYENNTDRKLKIGAGTDWNPGVTVNGFSPLITGTMLYMERLEPGAQKTVRVDYREKDLMTCGITDIACLEFRFTVRDDYDEDVLVTEPLKVETSSAGTYDLSADTYQAAAKDGRLAEGLDMDVTKFMTKEFFSADGVKVESAALVKDGNMEFVILEVENTTDQIQSFQYDEFAVNGLVFGKRMGNTPGITLFPHNRGLMKIIISGLSHIDAFEAFGIHELTDVSFMGAVTDEEGNELSERKLTEVPFNGISMPDLDGEEIYNDHGIRMILKGTGESKEYFYLLVTAVNDSDDRVWLNNQNGTKDMGIIVNGVRTGFSYFDLSLSPGRSGAMEVGIDKNKSSISLEKNGITVEDIRTVSFPVIISSGSKDSIIDVPSVPVEFSAE